MPRVASLAPKRVVPLSAKLAVPAPSGTGLGGVGLQRIMHELGLVARGDASVWLSNGEGVHIFPGEADATKWRALIEAPAHSPFRGGTFSLVVVLPADYPRAAPTLLFETPVYHCNVSESGTVSLQFGESPYCPLILP